MTASPRSPRVLTELIAVLGEPETGLDVAAALGYTTALLQGDLAGIVVGGAVVATQGPSPDAEKAVLGLVDNGTGDSCVAVESLNPLDGVLVVARDGAAFDEHEVDLVAEIGAVLGMALRMSAALEAERITRSDLEQRAEENRRLLDRLRERQGLLDRLHRIEQSISHRLPVQQVLDAITEGARDLLGVNRAAIWLRSSEGSDELTLVSHTGVVGSTGPARRVHIGDQVPASVFEDAHLVARYDLADRAHMSTAIEVDGVIVGCLSVGDDAAHRFSSAEEEALLAFAQHASLAMQDAQAGDQMRKSLERERHRASHDGLTSLPNRATIRAELARRLASANDGATTVLFVDLDRFKLANDTLGHAFGDEILTVIADRLRTTVREQDLVGRLSGDEFVVVCGQMTAVGARELAARLQEAIGRSISFGDVNHVMTASVGIAEATPGQSADEVLADADLAMYRAKQGGRARIDVFDDLLRSQVADRLSAGQDLRHAVERGEFLVLLQPLVELPTRRVVEFEALVRWQHPVRGLLDPSAFLPAAEDLGLVAAIDRVVLAKSIELLGLHRSARPIAVNLSERSFGDPDLVGWLGTCLRDHDVDPDRLVVELTETVLMDQEGVTANQIRSLRALGVGIAIDDFGTGYSSLSYLQTFDVDCVKIDRSFIARLTEDPRAEAIVGAVLSMAEALHVSVVAEGIETDDQVDRLVAISSRFPTVPLSGQGYLFGLPAEANHRLDGFVEMPRATSSR